MAERLASFVSGGGSTMEQIVLAAKRGEIPNLEMGAVIASSADAGAIDRARRLGIAEKDIVVIEPRKLRTPEGKMDADTFAEQLIAALRSRAISIITQNGWLPLTPKPVIEEYRGRIFNQHPGPLPAFGGKGMYGLRVHAAVREFLRITGNAPETRVIAQEVAAEFDAGAVVGRARIAVRPEDTPESLQSRALPQEHRLQIQLLRDFVKGRLQRLENDDAFVKPGQEEALGLAKEHAIRLYPRG